MNSFSEGIKALLSSSFFQNIISVFIGAMLTFIGVLYKNKNDQKRTLIELSYNKKYEVYQKLLTVTSNIVESSVDDIYAYSDIESFLRTLEECVSEVKLVSPKKICNAVEILGDNLFQLVFDSRRQDNENFVNPAFKKLLDQITEHKKELTLLIRKDLGSGLK